MSYHKSFEKFLKDSKYYKEMCDFVAHTKDLCPEEKNVFRFLNNDINNAKCIILGMDPYPATYDDNGVDRPIATGRSFEVADVKLWTDKYRQVSLANIFKTLAYLKFGKIYTIEELRKIVTKDNFRYINIHDWFNAMEKEGVVFLNATLTTIKHKSGVHEKIWTNFIDELIRYILDINKNIKWLIWGNVALNRVSKLVGKKNIVYTCHPATRVNNTFVKDCPFKNVKSVNWT